MTVPKDVDTGKFAMDITQPIFEAGELSAVVHVTLDLTHLLSCSRGPDNDMDMPLHPFRPELSIYQTLSGHSTLAMHTRIDPTLMGPDDHLEAVDVAGFERWVDRAAFDAFMARVNAHQAASVEVLTSRKVYGSAYTTVRTRVTTHPVDGHLAMVVTWPEHSHRTLILRPDVLPMGWCPTGYAGSTVDLLTEYTGVACYEPIAYGSTARFAGDDPANAAYRALFDLSDTARPSATNHSMTNLRWAAVKPEYRLQAGCDATLDISGFIDYNNRTAHPAAPPRAMDSFLSPEGLGEMQALSIMPAAYRTWLEQVPTIMDDIAAMFVATITYNDMNQPVSDYMTDGGLCDPTASIVSKSWFNTYFASDAPVFTNPYIMDIGGALGTGLGRTLHVLDGGYPRPLGVQAASLPISLIDAAFAARTSCASTMVDDVLGEAIYVDCFIVSTSLSLIWQSDARQLYDDARLSDTGRVTLDERYPELFAYLFDAGMFVRRTSTDYTDLTITEEYTIADSFGGDEKIIVDGRLISATCVGGFQLTDEAFAIARLEDPALLNRFIRACRIPGNSAALIITQNVTRSPERFAPTRYDPETYALRTTSLFAGATGTFSPGFGTSGRSTFDMDVVTALSIDGPIKCGICGVNSVAAPAEIIGVALAVTSGSIAVVMTLVLKCCRIIQWHRNT